MGWIIRLCKRLEQLHRLGVAHGSISAHLLLVADASYRSRGVLADVRQGATRPAYHSPERHAGKGISQSDDTWAIAVVLYQLLTGQLPFAGETTHAIKQRIASVAPAPLAVFDVGDDDLQVVLDEYLSPDTNQRKMNVGALRRALEQWHGEPGVESLAALEEDERTYEEEDEEEAIQTVMRDFSAVREQIKQIQRDRAAARASGSSPGRPVPASRSDKQTYLGGFAAAERARAAARQQAAASQAAPQQGMHEQLGRTQQGIAPPAQAIAEATRQVEMQQRAAAQRAPQAAPRAAAPRAAPPRAAAPRAAPPRAAAPRATPPRAAAQAAPVPAARAPEHTVPDPHPPHLPPPARGSGAGRAAAPKVPSPAPSGAGAPQAAPSGVGLLAPNAASPADDGAMPPLKPPPTFDIDDDKSDDDVATVLMDDPDNELSRAIQEALENSSVQAIPTVPNAAAKAAAPAATPAPAPVAGLESFDLEALAAEQESKSGMTRVIIVGGIMVVVVALVLVLLWMGSSGTLGP